MKIFTTYILYSSRLDRFYVGSTSVQMKDRLRRHNSIHSGFTGRASDWIVVYSCEFENMQESRKLERKIKKRGAKRFLFKLNIFFQDHGNKKGSSIGYKDSFGCIISERALQFICHFKIIFQARVDSMNLYFLIFEVIFKE